MTDDLNTQPRENAMTDTAQPIYLTAADRYKEGERWLADAVNVYPRPEAAAAAQIAAAWFASVDASMHAPRPPKPPVDMDEVRRHAEDGARLGRSAALHVSEQMGLTVAHAKHLVKALDGETAVQ